MAQTGYTPIQLYYSTTASAVPTNTNLANGELAINITDGKLYYKDNTGTVKVIAGAGGTGVVAGSNTQIQFNNNGVFGASANLTWDGTYLTANSIKNSALTSGRVTFASTSGLLADSSNLLWTGTGLGVNISPSYPIHAVGDPATSAIAAFRGTSTAANSRTIIAGNASGDLVAASDTSGNGLLYSDSGKTLAFGTNGSTTARLLIDTSGNLGLGVTPSAWSAYKAIQVNEASLAATTGSNTALTSNGYFDGTNWKYIYSNYATRYLMSSGAHSWSIAASGSSGTNISFTQAMTLDASGNLGVGATSPGYRLDTLLGAGSGNIFRAGQSGVSNGYTITTSGSALTHIWANGGSDAMRLDSSGNLGVGSTSPVTKLDVRGNVFIGTTASGDNVLAFGNTVGVGPLSGAPSSSQGNSFIVGESSNGSGYPGFLKFYTTTGGTVSERFRIAANGAWGLGGANYGTAGQVLTSNGSGAAPSWQAGGGGGGSAATPTSLGTVYASQTSGGGSPYLSAFGYNAGSGSTGNSNTAFGALALDASASGEANNAFGVSTLGSTTSGANNSAFGHNALTSNTTGSNNVAIGRQALDANTTSSNSVAIGYQALQQANPAVSGFGGEAVAIGYRAFYSLGTVASNGSGGCTAVGHAAGYSTTSAGNGAQDTFIGSYAGYYNVSGYNCTFVGASAGLGQTSGNSNTIVGAGAGRQTSGAGGSLCTIVGTNAGSVNSGSDNTFVGAAAGASNAGAVSNAYFGTYAGQSCTSSYNVAIGAEAMYSTTSASQNVAVGYGALRSMTNASGSHVAVGYQALYSATDNSNTAVGYRAGYGVTSGHNNVLLGINAGNSTVVLAGGAQNVVIGSGAYTNTAGAYNEIVIGQSCNGVGNDYVTIGKLNNRVYNHYDTNATWTQSSDVRLKTDIQDDSLGLSFINKLRPVKYRWKATNELELDNPHYNEVNNKNTTAVMHGLIAQEVKAALDEEGVSTFGGWDIEPNGIQGISREMFITPLINAVQELTAQVEALKAEVAALKGNV